MFWMLAQVSLDAAPQPVAVRLGVVAVVALAVVAVLVSLLLKNGQVRREWEHAERMQMLAMGLPVGPRESPWAKALVCVAIGAFVPVISFGITCYAYLESRAPQEGAIWVAPAVVSGLSVVGASILGGHLFGRRSGTFDAREQAQITRLIGAYQTAKAQGDPDAFDVVGSRG